MGGLRRAADAQGVLAEAIDALTPGEVRSKLVRAQAISEASSLQFAVSVLGNGTGMSAPDTVPFALWCCGQHLGNYTEALWLAVRGGGRRSSGRSSEGGRRQFTSEHQTPSTRSKNI